MGKLISRLSGWGRYPTQQAELERPERYAGLLPDAPTVIARGQGRGYGDAALNEDGRVLLTERINRLLDFDSEQGVLRAEAGATLADILDVIVPQGWFLPVTPGTRHVSLGGCVAADVHGKNHHHDGSFGAHVISIALVLADGSCRTCSPSENADLFWATVGGMGLTGVIGEVTLKLIPVRSAYMRVQNHAAENYDQLFSMMRDASLDDRYAVAWIDSMASGGQFGRGILMSGHHASPEELDAVTKPFYIKPERQRSIPLNFPSWTLNSFTISAFNSRYYRAESGKHEPFTSGYVPYFYPLDSIGHWNRMYGKRGFVQYQCVIPEEKACDGIAELLLDLADSGCPSFLAVLKRLGKQGNGMLSFPMAGYTLALDLPIRDDGLFALLDRLDDTVMQCGGRVYLAKDARLSARAFHAMYPRHEEWLKVKREVDPDNRFSSSLARRLGIAGEPGE